MAELTPCPSIPVLHRFLLGKVGDAEAAAIEDHLEACAFCRKRAGELDAVDPLVEAMRAQASLMNQADDPLVAPLIERLIPLRGGAAAPEGGPLEPAWAARNGRSAPISSRERGRGEERPAGEGPAVLPLRRPLVRLRWAAAAVLLVLASVALLARAYGVRNVREIANIVAPDGKLEVAVDDPQVVVIVAKGGRPRYELRGRGRYRVPLRPGRYDIATFKNDVAVDHRLVVIPRGGKSRFWVVSQERRSAP